MGDRSAQSASLQLYDSNPVWTKYSKDGLCPSYFDPECSTNVNVGANANSKSYRTNSLLLLQIKEETDVAREVSELQTIVDSVQTTLTNNIATREDMLSLNFEPVGCTWKVELGPGLPDNAADNYWVHIHIKANEIRGVMNFIVDTVLVPKNGNSSSNNNNNNSNGTESNGAPPLHGYKEAKAVFDFLTLIIRKVIVGLEFPEFPEGCKGTPFREVYQLNARLKSGSFATVCRGTHRATGRKVAIKCVLRKELPPADDAAIYDEVAILASLNHPHIVPIIDFFDEKDCYFIVMELMSGGDLFDRIGKKKAYSEADARDLIVKMLKAVAYCHARKIAHCDMKPKNLLLMSDDNDSFIKLADFGFAARVHEAKSLTKQCGTPFFVSPEILMRKPYDQQSDIWSVGCIVFLLLSGNLPFMGRSQKELFRKIVAGKYEFDDDDWQDVSDDAKDLVKRMLILNPDERISASEAIRHRWLKLSKDRLSMIVLQGTSQRLKTFNARMKLRSAMIAVDWVSSLKRMSWISSRSLNGAAASSGTSGRMLGAQQSTSARLAGTVKSMKNLSVDDNNSKDANGKGK